MSGGGDAALPAAVVGVGGGAFVGGEVAALDDGDGHADGFEDVAGVADGVAADAELTGNGFV